MHLFIRGVLLGEKNTNIEIANGRIIAIGSTLPTPPQATVIEGEGKAAFPTFANLHTHAAMVLFRGYGDDNPLQEWLNEWIWPKEKLLNSEMIYWAVRLACIEMIKSGTTAFNDMYFFAADAAKAIADSGIRAREGECLFGGCEPLLTTTPPGWQSKNITHAYNPHSIYTVTEEGLVRAAEYCKKHNQPFHIHMSETEQEVDDCIRQYGCRPYELIDRLGIMEMFKERFIGAHSLYLDEKEIDLIGRNGCTVVHNPNSNLKLGSGHQFLLKELMEAGANVTLGTDGASSSNNLDMLEATKTMALLQKGWRKEPTTLTAEQALTISTDNGFKALGIDTGTIEVGKLADLMLVDLNNIAFVPNNNTTSNLIYAAHSDAIDTVICDGNIVMRHRQVDGEQEVRTEVRKLAKTLLNC